MGTVPMKEGPLLASWVLPCSVLLLHLHQEACLWPSKCPELLLSRLTHARQEGYKQNPECSFLLLTLTGLHVRFGGVRNWFCS
jgi:hypothetical protein